MQGAAAVPQNPHGSLHHLPLHTQKAVGLKTPQQTGLKVCCEGNLLPERLGRAGGRRRDLGQLPKSCCRGVQPQRGALCVRPARSRARHNPSKSARHPGFGTRSVLRGPGRQTNRGNAQVRWPQGRPRCLQGAPLGGARLRALFPAWGKGVEALETYPGGEPEAAAGAPKRCRKAGKVPVWSSAVHAEMRRSCWTTPGCS